MSRSQDLRRTIIAVEYNENLYSVDTDIPIIPTIQYSPLIGLLENVTNLQVEEFLVKRVDGTIDNNIRVTYSIELLEWFTRTDIYMAESGTFAWRFIGSSGSNFYEISNVISLKTYDIAVIRVNKTGEQKTINDSPSVSLYVYGKTAPPEDVSNFIAQVSLNGIRLSWDAVSDIDISHYEVRWTSFTSGASWASSIFMEDTDSTTINFLAAKNGTYLIKAVDTTGNKSVNTTTVVTNVPAVINFNIKETLVEDPDFTGTKTNTVVNVDNLELDVDTDFDAWPDFDAVTDFDRNGDIKSEGFYESNEIDIGTVQTSRLSAVLEASGINYEDTFDDITDFDSITDFDGEEVTGVGVELNVNTSQNGVDYDGWERFTIGDFSARSFKFRVRLYTESITKNIQVSSLEFIVDMPDRQETGQLTTNAGGVDSISYTKVFISAPAPKITIQNGSEGDSYILTNATVSGFDIEIKNSAVRVSRLINWFSEKY